MRVAYVVGRFPVLSEPFILNQVTGAMARGCDVRVFAVQGPPTGTTKAHPDVARYGLADRTHYPPAPAVDSAARPAAVAAALGELDATHPLQSAALRGLWRDATTPPWKTLLRGISLARLGPFDVIHCQFGFFAEQMIALRDAGAHGAVVVTTFRGGDISRYVEERGAAVYARTFARGDYFLANCGFFRDRAVSIGCPAKRIEVHGSGIDLARFAMKERKAPIDGPVQIASTGRLVEKKGIGYVVDAVARLRAAGHNVHLNIIGDGPLRGAIEAQIAKRGCGSDVTLHGWRDQVEIIDILGRCHLFVAASVTAANGDQDAPVNTLKEAMAMGLPVVATAHGGIPELVQPGVSGWLVPERDAEAIAAALSRLIAVPGDWPAMGHAGRQAVEAQFDMARLNDRLVALYAELSQARAGGGYSRAS